MTEIAYGAWPSTITAEAVVAGARQLADPHVVGDEVWWVESRPTEGGRSVVCRERPGGGVEDLLPAPWSASTRVHEYGGTSWLPVEGGFVFSHREDQRVHLVRGGEPTPLTPAPDVPCADRFADFVPGRPGEVLCVREQHDGQAVRRSIVAVALDGSGVRELVADGHFLAAPALSPDGSRLAWLRWEHPLMPWDGTELRVADVLADGRLGPARTVAGGTEESVLQPEWTDEGLVALSDRSGWWNLHRFADDGTARPLHPAEEEFGGPLWKVGSRWYAVLGDGRLVVRHGHGASRVGVLDPATGRLEDLDLPYRSLGCRGYESGSLRSSGQRVVFVAGHPGSAAAVVEWDATTGRAREVRSSADAAFPADLLPEAVPATFGTPHGDVHALVFPPRNGSLRGLPGERVPYVVDIHGGPTSHCQPQLSPDVAYLTSRGIGVVQLNYRGSTGYGRAYRNALRGGWGVVDVEDAVGILGPLAERFDADPARVVITGGSSGGATVLAALVSTDAFAGGISDFGVTDFAALARDTHDFESRYLDSLIAPWPEGRAVYDERSPVNRIDGLRSPVLLLQGAEDKVVPRAQAEAFAAAAAARGLPHHLLVFEGEGHGWTRAETMVTALEAKLAFLGEVFGFTPA